MAFADSLDGWLTGGSFLRDASGSHFRDYSVTAGNGSAVLASAVSQPYGRAFLGQVIFADDYRGSRVVFGCDLRTEDVADHAELHLQVISEESAWPHVRSAASPAGT